MISTHVLDIARGAPASGVAVDLERRDGDEWTMIGGGVTDEKGRITALVPEGGGRAGTYRLTFALGDYHRDHGIAAPFFPEAQVVFDVRSEAEHFHVPLVISPFGYSTYRGA